MKVSDGADLMEKTRGTGTKSRDTVPLNTGIS